MADITKEMQLKVSTKDTDKAKSKLSGVEKSIASMAKTMTGAVISAAALKKAFDFTIASSVEQEKIFRTLQTSIELTGKSYAKAKGSIDSTLASLQAMTAYGDETTAQALTTLVQLTGNLDESLKALPLTVDMASSGLFDLNTSARYVAMVMEGNVEILGRYIPSLKAANNEIIANGTAAQKAAEGMRILNEKFGGTAEKNLDSTISQYEQMTNYLGDIGQSIGDTVLPMLNELFKSFHSFLGLTELTKGQAGRSIYEQFAGRLNEIEDAYKKSGKTVAGFWVEQKRVSEGLYNIDKLFQNNQITLMGYRKALQDLFEPIEKIIQQTSDVDAENRDPFLFITGMKSADKFRDSLELIEEQTVKLNDTAIQFDQWWTAAFTAAENMAANFTNYMSSAILQMANSNIYAFKAIENAFRNMLTRMVAEYASRAVIFSVLNMVSGGGLGALSTVATKVLGGQGAASYIFGGGASASNITPSLQSSGGTTTSANNLTVIVNGNFTDVDKLAQEIADRSRLGFNKIAVNS